MINRGKISCNPYITFNGTCREAMTFYSNVLEGRLEIMPFSDAPFETPPEEANKVLHASLMFGLDPQGSDTVLMAADAMPGKAVMPGTNSHVSIAHTNLAEATRIFEGLSKGGAVMMPFEDTFWGATFGMVIDKYGVQWMVHCEK